MKAEQVIIERLYREIDGANLELERLGVDFRIIRQLHVMHTAIQVSVPEPPQLGGSICRECGGMMIRTGMCETCLDCGTPSGGCD